MAEKSLCAWWVFLQDTESCSESALKVVRRLIVVKLPGDLASQRVDELPLKGVFGHFVDGHWAESRVFHREPAAEGFKRCAFATNFSGFVNPDRALSVPLQHVLAVFLEEANLLNIYDGDEVSIEVASQLIHVFKLAAVVVEPSRNLVRRHDFNAFLLQASQQAVGEGVFECWCRVEN